MVPDPDKALLWFGKNKNAAVKKTLKWFEKKNVMKKRPDWKRPEAWSLYDWFLRTQTLFLLTKGEGKFWKERSGPIINELVRNQEDDGSWLAPMEANGKGSDGETSEMFETKMNLKVYSTALCVLTLEVFYRFKTEFDLDDGSTSPEIAHEMNDDDLNIVVD